MWKQFKCPVKGEWINKLRHMHKLEYYTPIKRNELLMYATIIHFPKIYKQKMSNIELYSIWHKIIPFV